MNYIDFLNAPQEKVENEGPLQNVNFNNVNFEHLTEDDVTKYFD